MRNLLVRSLILNLVAILVSGALMQWYPKNSGFTLTAVATTRYFSGGEFLGLLLICFCDLALVMYLGWRLWHPQ